MTIDKHSFEPSQLRAADRQPGISGFVRTRNGADFISAAIRSHISYVDEIVVVYNQCTDQTEAILAALQSEFGPERLKVYHYLPRVFPPGSDEHIVTPADSPHSIVNYSNLALALTNRSLAFKIDDDHVAMDGSFANMVADINRRGLAPGRMMCFSGLNLARSKNGRVGVLAAEPFAGNGDHGFFHVTPDTYFVHDRRYEQFRKHGVRRVFSGFAYWHLKYLKSGFGFANYEIARGNNRRFARKEREFHLNRDVVSIAEVSATFRHLRAHILRLMPVDKWSILANREIALADGAVTDMKLHDFLRSGVVPDK